MIRTVFMFIGAIAAIAWFDRWVTARRIPIPIWLSRAWRGWLGAAFLIAYFVVLVPLGAWLYLR